MAPLLLTQGTPVSAESQLVIVGSVSRFHHPHLFHSMGLTMISQSHGGMGGNQGSSQGMVHTIGESGKGPSGATHRERGKRKTFVQKSKELLKGAPEIIINLWGTSDPPGHPWRASCGPSDCLAAGQFH